VKYNPNIHHRRSIRLKGYDYSKAGLYFITIVVKDRLHLLGEIENGKMVLNEAGKMVGEEWLKIPQRFTNTRLHEYQVMPNHFHAILEIIDGESAVGSTLVVEPETVNRIGQPPGLPQRLTNPLPQRSTNPLPQPIIPESGFPKPSNPIKSKKTLGDMVGAFESITTVEYIRGVKSKNWQPFNGKLWQRNYWEHIIRNEEEYQRISNYIRNNPSNWKKDKFSK
jgi:REP element-mobilizing transposase RayT